MKLPKKRLLRAQERLVVVFDVVVSCKTFYPVRHWANGLVNSSAISQTAENLNVLLSSKSTAARFRCDRT